MPDSVGAQRKNHAIVFDIDENWMGGSYYIRNLVSALATLSDDERPEVTIVASHASSFSFLRKTGFPNLHWITREQFDSDPDGFPFSSIFPWPIHGQDYRTVAWIPDFQDRHLPEFFSKTDLESRIASHRRGFECAGLIVSSEDVKRDVETFYPGESKAVEVVRFAAFDEFDSSRAKFVRSKYKINGSFIICPNQVWIHKNHVVVLRAIAHLKSRGTFAQVVLTGSESDYRAKGYADALKMLCAEWGISDRVHFLGFIPREDQLCLMKEASFVLQPSLFEGWSTVIEDAKAMNQYVVASDLSVHREQLTSNAQFFPRSDPIALADLLLHLITSPPQSNVLDYNINRMEFARGFVRAINRLIPWSSLEEKSKRWISRKEFAVLVNANIAKLPPEMLELETASADPIEVVQPIKYASPTRALAKQALSYLDHAWYNEHYLKHSTTNKKIERHFLGEGWVLGNSPTPFFDPDYYLEKNGDVQRARVSPFAHFLEFGQYELRDPHPLIDLRYYVALNAEDGRSEGLGPFEHLLKFGLAKNRVPNRVFDCDYYNSCNGELQLGQWSAFEHFLREGAHQDRAPHALFDVAFYGRRYPELLASSHSLVEHFMRIGLYEGYQPNALFDPTFYSEIYTDVGEGGVPPFAHFIQVGLKQGRQPHPMFVPEQYWAENPDVAEAAHPAVNHLLFYGLKEGRMPHPLFDEAFYIGRYPDVLQSGIPPFLHFLEIGISEGRIPNAYFDTSYYLRRHPEVARSGIPPFLHYLKLGQWHNLEPSVSFDARHYLASNPDVVSAGHLPLYHYLKHGKRENRAPTHYVTIRGEQRFAGAAEYYNGG